MENDWSNLILPIKYTNIYLHNFMAIVEKIIRQ